MRGKFTSPTLKLRITEETWDNAVKASSGSCIIADAIKTQYPHLSGISVDMATIRVSDQKKGLRYTYLTPDAAQVLLLSFDQGWAQPEQRELTVRSAVKTTKIQRAKNRAAARQTRLAKLEALEAVDGLTSDDKRALRILRNNPERPSSAGKPEVAASASNRTVHGRAPKQGPDNPNLLRGRNRQFGKKIARPAVLFEAAVQKAVDERIEKELAAKG